MKSFVDARKRKWEINLTLRSAMRIKADLGVDILQPESGDPPLMTRLAIDEEFLGHVIHTLLADQLQTSGVSIDDFLEAVDGRVLLDMQTALWEELVDFFQSRGRTDRARAIRAQRDVMAKAIAMVEQKADRLDLDKALAAMESRMEADLQRAIPGESSGTSQESPASSPGI